MNLIEVLSSLFDSFSFVIGDFIGVGTVEETTWYVYLVTPETRERINSMLTSDLLFCPRDKNLSINLPRNASSRTPLCICDEDMQQLKNEVRSKSVKRGLGNVSFPKECDADLEEKYLEINMVV